MNYVSIIILVVLSLCNTLMPQSAFAQDAPQKKNDESRFKASVMAGVNLSQIHGDQQDGYRKQGLNLGLSGTFIITPDIDVSAELLYNEKGATRPQSQYRINKYYTDISLKYSEMALLARYYFSPRVSDGYYKQSIKLGFSYGRLLKSETNVIQNNLLATTIAQSLNQSYNRSDISFVAAWSYYLLPRLNFTVRHTNSLNYLLKNTASLEKVGYDNMSPYFLSLQMTYDFIAPNKGKGKVIVRKRKKARYDPLEELY